MLVEQGERSGWLGGGRGGTGWGGGGVAEENRVYLEATLR